MDDQGAPVSGKCLKRNEGGECTERHEVSYVQVNPKGNTGGEGVYSTLVNEGNLRSTEWGKWTETVCEIHDPQRSLLHLTRPRAVWHY
jgi:hypothetical protein